MLRLTTLGYPQIALDDQLITDFVSNKVIALLCYLVLTQRTHSREVLAGLFWGDMSDARALANLRQALHNLQKNLPDHFVISRETASYNPDMPYWIDVQQLRQGIEHGDPDADTLASLCDLYRGDFLEGFHFDQAPSLDAWLQNERGQYQALYSNGLEQLANARIQRGLWHPAIESAEKLLLMEPWRESAHRQLMLARARMGDYAAALAYFERCCQILNNELGISPSAETLHLYEQICQAQDRPRHNLPPELSPLIGREALLAQLAEQLSRPNERLITIIGPGGVGKSRLAQAVAMQQQHLFLNGVWHIPLALVDDPDFVHFAIAQALNLRFSNFGSSEDQLINSIRQQEMLIILDSYEHLSEGITLLQRILEQAPQVRLMVTTRRRLNVQGEKVIAVEGLALADESATDADALQQVDSIRFFLQCAAQHHPANITDAELPIIAQMCRLLDGSPLAIELAAALLPVIDCAGILAEIQQNLGVLDITRAQSPERHRSLRAVFNHSWSLLNRTEQQILAQTAVFRGGFTLEAARDIVQTDLQTLSSLIAQSLLYVRSKAGDPRRYDLHDILRHYVDEMLQSRQELAARVQAAHRLYYSQFVQASDATFIEQGIQPALSQIEQELPNIRQCWHNAIAARDFEAISRMVRVLHKFYEGRSWYQEGTALFEQALSIDPPQSPQEYHIFARLHAHTSGLFIRMGQMARARELAEQSVRIFQMLEEEDQDAGFAFNTYGITLLYTGSFDEARNAFDQCALIYRKLGNHRELLKPLTNLGSLLSRIGDNAAAMVYLEEGLQLARQVGDRRGLCHFVVNLGVTYHLLGRYEEAENQYQEGLILSREVEYPNVQIAALSNLAQLSITLGKFEQAIASCEEGLLVAEQIRDLRQTAICWKYLAIAHQSLGHLPEARDAIQKALHSVVQTRALATILEILQGAGHYLMLRGKTHSATETLQLVVRHPSTEAEYRNSAATLLEQMGQKPGETQEDIPLERLIDAVIPGLLDTI